MGWFSGSRDRSRDDASRVAPPVRVMLPRLERDESDARWVLLELLHDAGLSFVYHAPIRVETLFSRVMAAAPRLANSAPRGQSPFAMLNRGVAWTLVDNGRSSAVILVVSVPSAADDHETREILDDLMNKVIFVLDKADLAKEVVMNGETSTDLADLLQRGEVVAPWEVPGQQVLPRPPYWTTLPITVHRAAKGWERVTSYLYRKAFDVEDTIMTVHLGLIDGQPRLACTFDSQPDGNLDGYGWVTANGEHTLWWFNPAVAACTQVPTDVDAGTLTTLSRELIEFIAAGFLGITKPPATLRRRTTAFIWSVVESPPPGAEPAAAFQWPGVRPEDYLSCERVRHAVSGAGFEEVEAAARELLATWGSGFASALRRGPDTERMSPDWLAVNAATFDPDTGRLVLVGHPNHHLLGLPPPTTSA